MRYRKKTGTAGANASFDVPRVLVRAVALICLCATLCGAATVSQRLEVPVKGMVTMVDIGSHGCLPCRMMTPILEELERQYKDKAAIVFIDLGKLSESGQTFGIRAVPTQIFYDKEGKESYRHEGFLDKESIIGRLEMLGVR